MRTYSLAVSIGLLILAGCVYESSESTSVSHDPQVIEHVEATQSTTFYTVAIYDPARDANEDLIATIDQAKSANKRIILEVGGNW